MSLATLDTHEVVKDLVGAGFTDEQAAAVARNIRKAQDLDISSLATKVDLEKVRTEVEKVRGEVARIPSEIRKDIAESKSDMLKYMIGTIGFQTMVILAAVVTLIKVVRP